MKNNSIKRFYIMPEVWVTVTHSQVFNWIKLVNESGISTDCISITSKKNDNSIIKKYEESINGRFIEVKDYRKLIINDIYISYIFFKFYLRNVFKFKKIIFQTRLDSIGFTFAFLRWLPKTKFIFESRAAKNEERIHINEGKIETFKMKIKHYFAKTSEKLMLTNSNKIICVSHALKNYYLNKYKLSDEKFRVFPGAADADLFFYDKSIRNNIRKELCIGSNDILIVYSGRLEMKWEIPDKIFDFFKDLHSRNPRFKLLLITPDVDLADDFIKDNRLENITYVKKVELKDVNQYLNSADVGLLLRENIPMNNVASPTKFAEYLMAGLPVIISSSVHDFANDINDTGYGIVVSSLDKISKDEFENLLGSLKIDKQEIAIWGLHNLSKGTFIERYIDLLNQI